MIEREFIDDAEWQANEKYAGLHELFAEDGTLLAFVQERPLYCDRGQYVGQLEYTPGNPLDAADGGWHYYMRLDVAKQELREKLLWRNCKIRPV